jgi:hypothetical protein
LSVVAKWVESPALGDIAVAASALGICRLSIAVLHFPPLSGSDRLVIVQTITGGVGVIFAGVLAMLGLGLAQSPKIRVNEDAETSREQLGVMVGRSIALVFCWIVLLLVTMPFLGGTARHSVKYLVVAGLFGALSSLGRLLWAAHRLVLSRLRDPEITEIGPVVPIHYTAPEVTPGQYTPAEPPKRTRPNRGPKQRLSDKP